VSFLIRLIATVLDWFVRRAANKRRPKPIRVDAPIPDDDRNWLGQSRRRPDCN